MAPTMGKVPVLEELGPRVNGAPTSSVAKSTTHAAERLSRST
jgi:hypothetical protein